MLRSDLNIIMDYHRGVMGGLVRGKVLIESADLTLYKKEGQLVGTAFSIPVYRDTGVLINGKFQYYDSAGTLIASN